MYEEGQFQETEQQLSSACVCARVRVPPKDTGKLRIKMTATFSATLSKKSNTKLRESSKSRVN